MSVTTDADSGLVSGSEGPDIAVPPPGPRSRAWLQRGARALAPMGLVPARAGPVPVGSSSVNAIVYASGRGSNVVDVDGNRYVDLAGGFGALLLGHGHPAVLHAVARQAQRLLQALGDVHPSDVRVLLAERLATLHPARAQVILGQSGADAVSAALKTALLHTGRSGVVAFHGAYHGLSYGPLAACGLRAGYREPFRAQLNPAVRFVDYPSDESGARATLEQVERALAVGDVGAVLVEPILGRGGCVVPPAGFLPRLARVAHAGGALLIADEIWTGLARAGRMLYSIQDAVVPDLICLGKGLGGGLPVSACLGSEKLMQAWRRDPEVVHTSTHAGAPLACAAALATLDTIDREGLVERSASQGEAWRTALRSDLHKLPGVEVRGAGLMIGIDLARHPLRAVEVARALLQLGYIVSTGGGARDTLVLTPPLTVAESQLQPFASQLRQLLAE
jgi:4-aminobutyrate aminotransferase-like enzyme